MKKKKKIVKWKEFEEDIHQLLKEQYPDSTLLGNHYIKGRYSKRKRQIDVLLEGFTGGRKFRQLVECKYYNKKINVKIIESILGFLDDVSADRAIIITNKGYSKSAYKRAHNDPRFIELQICSFEELKEYQGLYALSFRGRNGLIIKAPIGWITDNSAIGPGSTCNLHLRGKSIEESMRYGDLVVINIRDKSSKEIDYLQTYRKNRNGRLKRKEKLVVIEEIDTVSRNDATILLDKISISNVKMQYSGYLDFDEFIVTMDLMIAPVNESNRLPIIEQLLFETKPYVTVFESDVDAAFWNMSETYKTIEGKDEKLRLFEHIKEAIALFKKESPSHLEFAKKYFSEIPELFELIK